VSAEQHNYIMGTSHSHKSCNDCMEWNTSVRPIVTSAVIKLTVNRNYCCAIVHYKNVNPLKVGGDKTQGVPSSSKSRGDMSPCPPTDLRPWISAKSMRYSLLQVQCEICRAQRPGAAYKSHR